MLVVAAAVAAVGSGASAQQVSREDVYAALGVDQVPGDLVVLVDTSGSMAQDDLYGRVATALRPLLDTVAPADHVALITFDTAPAVRFSGRVEAGQSPLSQLPPDATGQATDIGAAIGAGIDELARPDASDIATLVLLTDGRHDPPAGSAFPAETGPAWEELRQRAAELTAQRRLRAYALELRADTDARLLKTVFPDTTVVALPPDQLEGYLGRVREQARADKARALLAADQQAVVRATWPQDVRIAAEPRAVTVRLTSEAQHLPLHVAIRDVGAQPEPVSLAEPPATISLDPGDTGEVEVELSWVPPSGFRFGRSEVTAAATLSLAAEVTTPWAPVLADEFDLTPEPRLDGGGTAATLTGVVGWGWPTLLAILAGILAVGGYGASRWVGRNPILRGTLVARVEADGTTERVRLSGRTVRIGRGRGSRLDIPGSGRVRGRRSGQRTAGRGGRRGGRRSGRAGRSGQVDLVIEYGRDGGTSRHVVPPGSAVRIDGVEFRYQS